MKKTNLRKIAMSKAIAKWTQGLRTDEIYRQQITLVAMFVLVTFSACGSAFGAFEQIGAGARPVGMGSAFTALSDDAHAIYYNPSGLGQIQRGELTVGYGKLYVGLEDKSNLGSGYFGVVQPLKGGEFGALGIGWLTLSLDGAYRENLISFTYGKEILDGLFLGGTGKVLKRSYGSDIYTQNDPLFARSGFNVTNYSGDVGMLYHLTRKYSFGVVLKDLNQPDVGLGTEDRLPLEIRAGIGVRLRRLLIDSEFSLKEDDLSFFAGLERRLFRYVGLRAGFSMGSRDKREVASGMSYVGEHFEMDYAFVLALGGIESTSGSHRFGLTVRFGKPEGESGKSGEEKLLEESWEGKPAEKRTRTRR